MGTGESLAVSTTQGDDNTSTDSVEVLSDIPDNGVVEEEWQEFNPTTDEEGEYDTLIQGSDRTYPAIILRRKHRGMGATIKTISKNGKFADLYNDYKPVIDSYLERRQNKGQAPRSRQISESVRFATPENWLSAVVQSIVQEKRRGSEDGDSLRASLVDG